MVSKSKPILKKRRQQTLIRKIMGGTSREEHLDLNYCVGLVTGLVGLVLTYPYHYLAVIAMFAVWAQERWATPDRDVEETRARAHWYWLIYGRIVPHRHWLSHGPVGTVLRTVYGWWPVFLLWPLSPAVVVAWLVGCVVSDMAHYWLDL